MSDIKQYKKQSKQLKCEIRAAKAHLAMLEQELRELRQSQQHQIIDEEMDQLLEQSDIGLRAQFRRFIQLFKSKQP
ncbi:MAG: hypothetical protein ACR2PT_23180 [Endozoicomonas sp.]